MEFIDYEYGSIREVSSSSFLWHVPKLIDIIEGGKRYILESPYFWFGNYRSQISLLKFYTISGAVSRLRLGSSGHSVARPQTYRLRVIDIHGEHYRPFPVTKQTLKPNNCGSAHDQPESHLLKDASWRVPGGDLFVFLEFYPEERERLPGVGAILPAESRPRNTDSGTETGPDRDSKLVPPVNSVSSSLNGIWKILKLLFTTILPAESRPSTADCGTQTTILPAESRPSTTYCGTQISTIRRRKPRPSGVRSVASDSDDIENLVQDLKDLLLCGRKNDITLVVQGKELKAHQNILAARSPVFSAMFNEEWLEQASGTVQITDCDAEAFQDFLLYLYTGEVETLEVKTVVELFTIADKYDIKSLAKICVDFMILNLTVDSFCDFVPLALRHCELRLMDSANSFFAENVKQIIATEKWKAFNAQNPNTASELLVKALCQ